MGTETNKEERNTPEYLAQLLKDKKQVQAFPNVFLTLERLLDEEINKVRVSLFHLNSNKDTSTLPDAQGPVVTCSEKLFVPVKEHPDFNFVGRILGPRGMTAKQLEQDTGCKIMVRGKGSMRDKKKEEMNRGKPNWEHLNEELHVLITVEDTRNRADMKMKRAVDEVKRLLVPAPEGEDDLKKMQLMELAIINGTYRDTKIGTSTTAQEMYLNRALQSSMHAGLLTEHQQGVFHQAGLNGQFSDPRLAMQGMQGMQGMMRSPTPQGAPIILAPRMQSLGSPGLMNGGPPPLISPADAGLMYPYEYPYGMAHTLLEYPTGIDQSAAGAVRKVNRHPVGMREHPYTRVSLA